MFHKIIERQTRRTFARVNAHNYDAILKGALPDVRHTFAGEHALGGQRNDVEHLRAWFERLGRIMPALELEVTDVWVHGGLWKAVVIVRWNATATLLDGSPYTKRMLDYLGAHPELLGTKHEYTVVHSVLAVPHRAAAYVGAEVVRKFYEDDAEAVFRPIRAF